MLSFSFLKGSQFKAAYSTCEGIRSECAERLTITSTRKGLFRYMADDIKSLANRVQQLETLTKGRGKVIEELERKGKYLDGILDTQNKLQERVASLERRFDDLSKRVSNLANKG
jgi:hypothetical protein